MLGWSQSELAKAANVARQTIADFERGARIPIANNLIGIRKALEEAGVEFLPANGIRLNSGPGTESGKSLPSAIQQRVKN